MYSLPKTVQLEKLSDKALLNDPNRTRCTLVKYRANECCSGAGLVLSLTNCCPVL